jgi:hypothetical protein
MKGNFDCVVASQQHRRQRICSNRKETENCGCRKARYEQACQCCKEKINIEDCIKHEGHGWVHSVCDQDENRGLPAIEAEFTPSVNRGCFLESEPPAKRPRLMRDGDEEDEDDEEDLKPEAEADEESHHEKLTEEQRRLLNYEPEVGEVVGVNALAGCGKTTTIAEVCNKFKNKHSLLYLVFNKKNQDEASKSAKFPRKVEIRTTHAFVLRLYFEENRFKVKPVDDHHLDDIIESTGLTAWVGMEFPGLNDIQLKSRINSIAGFIRRTVKNFEASAAEDITEKHVPWRANTPGSTKRTEWKIVVGVKLYVSWSRKYFNEIHEKCKQVRDGKATEGIEIPYDTYLKAAQLERLQSYHVYVLIDEAQDMTPCQADLFWGDHVRRNRVTYLFGDRHQQLYRFRGASKSFCDMLESRDTTCFSLTGSFRFGEEIATIATSVLKAVSGEPLKGRSNDPGTVQRSDDGMSRPPGVVLCRSNNGIMKYLFAFPPKKWCYLDGRRRAMPEIPRWVKELENAIDIVGDTPAAADPNLELNQFRYKGEEFNSMDDLRGFADEEEDHELMRYLDLVRFLKPRQMTLADFKETIEKSFQPCKGPIENYDGIVFATVHKAKGLEFKNVFVFDDFDFKAMGSKDLAAERRQDELNVLYVAVTRAKSKLLLIGRLSEFVEGLGSIDSVRASVSVAELRSQWEDKWIAFDNDQTEITSIDDIPWPSNLDDDSPSLLLDSRMSEDEQRQFLRKTMLRFHPDRFLPKFRRRFKSGVKGLPESIKKRVEGLQRQIVDAKNELEPRGEN